MSDDRQPHNFIPPVTPDDDAFVDRCLSFLVGELDETATALFERQLAADPAARRLFAAVCLQRRMLTDLHRAASTEQHASAGRPHTFRIPRIAYTLAAALLLAACGVAIYLATLTPDSRPPTPDSAPVATLVAADAAAWGGDEMYEGDDIGAMPIVLESGSAELLMKLGATVTLTGPCEFELTGPNGGSLRRGKLHAIVPHAAAGFAVTTPHGARVIDLGTEFTVIVDADGRAMVRVVEGRVAVERPGQADRPTLAAGQWAHIGLAGEPLRYGVGLDLLDVISGGDGTTHRRDARINPATGEANAPSTLAGIGGDGSYHRCPTLPFVDGVFIPRGGHGPVQVDSAGHRFDGFPATDQHSHAALATRAGDELYMHANKGVTIDLTALAARHGQRPSRLAAMVHNAAPAGTQFSADAWVLIDGQPRFSARAIRGSDGSRTIDIELNPDDRFLTLVATDAGDGLSNDGIVFSKPQLMLNAASAEPASGASETNIENR